MQANINAHLFMYVCVCMIAFVCGHKRQKFNTFLAN